MNVCDLCRKRSGLLLTPSCRGGDTRCTNGCSCKRSASSSWGSSAGASLRSGARHGSRVAATISCRHGPCTVPLACSKKEAKPNAERRGRTAGPASTLTDVLLLPSRWCCICTNSPHAHVHAPNCAYRLHTTVGKSSLLSIRALMVCRTPTNTGKRGHPALHPVSFPAMRTRAAHRAEPRALPHAAGTW